MIEDGVEICIKYLDGKIEMGLCTCERCCDFFDLQIAFAFDRNADCKVTYSPYCPCYETSKMSFVESLIYQNHSICTQCKYDSHCNAFNPFAVCLQDVAEYTIGNPFITTPTNYGFKDLIRDHGRVTDGKIKGDSCDCETNIQEYKDVDGNIQQYRIFPEYQIAGTLNDCLDCLAHPFKFESSCYPVYI